MIRSGESFAAAFSGKVAEITRQVRLLPPPLLVGFIGGVVILIAAGVVTALNLRNVYNTNEAVAHSSSVKAGLEQLFRYMVDAETGQRGFIITGQPAYLRPYENAKEEISSAFAEVRNLTADNRDQRSDLEQLKVMADVKLAELARAIQLRRTSGLEAVQAIVSTNVGKRTMDDMRDVVARMEGREDQILGLRTSQAAQSYRAATWTLWFTTGLALIVMVALFLGTGRGEAEGIRAAQSAERLRVILASIGDAVIASDDQARVTQMNRAAMALTGWTEAEAAGMRLEDVFRINDDFRRPTESLVARVFRENTVVELPRHALLTAKDGTQIPVEVSAAPLQTEDGGVSGVVLVFRDVTEPRRVEQERQALMDAERAARRDAERANRLKDEFLAVLSHELRTPLSSILGWISAMNSENLTPEKQLYALQAIERGARAEAQLVESLLDLSRIMSGKLNLEMEHLDLVPIVHGAVDMVRPSAEVKNVSIHVQVPTFLMTIGDAPRLQQVVANLLTNAVKFTPSGGRIDVILDRIQSTARLQVRDNGQGIRPEFLPHIFDRFAQGGPNGRARVGLGLGLAIVRELVQAHNGAIQAASMGEGEGSTFTVTLPVAAAMAAADIA
jgi:PAS domain S-box-containing protein